MRPALAVGVACALATAATGLTRTARAAASDFQLDYKAPVVCPSEKAFVADARARIADRGATADGRHFRVRIIEERGTYRGALETLDPPSVREVTADNCEEVVRALVVFLALAISPADSRDVSAVGPPLIPPPTARVEPPTARVEPDLPPRRPPLRPRFGLDVQALVVAGVTPGVAPGVAGALTFEVQTHRAFRWVAHGGGLIAYREKSVLDGDFVFVWPAARIDAGAAFDAGRFRLSGGPVVHAGMLSVQARDLPSGVRYRSFWGDLGGFARADVTLTPSVALTLMAELVVPTRRRTFGIQGISTPIHEISPVVGIISLGVTLRP